jgi:precorrin-6x reductase
MIVGQTLGPSPRDGRIEHAVGESGAEFAARSIGPRKRPQGVLQRAKLLQFLGNERIGLQQAFHPFAFIRAEGVIQVAGQQLIEEIFW